MKQIAALTVPLDGNSDTPYYLQLYNELRRSILSGTLLAGTRLPSTRALSQQLSISRNTVTAAFDQLLAEGYLEGKSGSGTYVASRLPEELLSVRAQRNTDLSPEPRNLNVSRSARLLLSIPAGTSLVGIGGTSDDPRAFQPHLPAVEEFPSEIWLKLTARCWRKSKSDLLGYGDWAGYQRLREQIASYVKTSRAVRCEPEQVIVVSGSQQGLDLAVKLLVESGESVWVEDPGYTGVKAVFHAAGAKVIPVPVDSEGLVVETGIALDRKARMVYVTPSHQYPLGMTMSLCRRLALLEWAHQSNAWILEDDYDSEYRYGGRPLASLQGLDTQGRVIYIGTFSKVLLPSLRLGYVVVPPDLVDAFVAARGNSSGHAPLAEQAVLAEFIAEGHFSRHIRRMRNLYEQRQAHLIKVIRRELAGLVEVNPSEAGMSLIGWLPVGVDDREMAAHAARANIDTRPLSAHAITPVKRGGLILGYAGLNERHMDDAAKRLAKALRGG